MRNIAVSLQCPGQERHGRRQLARHPATSNVILLINHFTNQSFYNAKDLLITGKANRSNKNVGIQSVVSERVSSFLNEHQENV